MDELTHHGAEDNHEAERRRSGAYLLSVLIGLLAMTEL